MGGKSESNTTQTTVSNPWAPAQPALTGILGQVGQGLQHTGVTGAENNALNTAQGNADNYARQYAPQFGQLANDQLAGGGAMNQAGAVNQNYQNYYNQTNPLASNTNYDPYNTPGVKDLLATLTGDITNNTNGAFAAAGRDFSGANSMALGRGLTQGLAPVLLGQYNQNVQNQQGAAGNLYNAGNTNAGLLAGMQQQSLANRQAGTQTAQQGLDAQNTGANAAMQAEATRRGIPVQALGLLAQIGIPIAGLGSTSTTTGHSDQTMSGAQQFGQIAGGFGSLVGTGGPGTGSIAGAQRLISDRNAKEDIAQVGTLFDGTPVYRFRYIGQPAFQIGLMAQDIEKTTPEAVGRIGQFKAVDYKLATDKAVEAA